MIIKTNTVFISNLNKQYQLKTTEKEKRYLTCPECGSMVVATNMPAEKWREKTDQEKETLKQRFDKIKERQNVFASEGVNKTANVIKTAPCVFMVLALLGGSILLITEK